MYVTCSKDSSYNIYTVRHENVALYICLYIWVINLFLIFISL